MPAEEQVEEHFEHRVGYYPQWDSEYCHTCKIWIDDECEDPDCIFCTEPRPDKPK